MKKNNIPLNFTEKNKSRISLICSIVVLVVLCFALHQLNKVFVPADSGKNKSENTTPAPTQEPAQISTANIVAVGDNRFSSTLISSGGSDSGTYNFDQVYSEIKNQVTAADMAMVNQETVLTADSDNFSGEDTFASPTAVGDALVNTGFDAIASASNHTDDFGSEMIKETLDYWKTSHPDTTILGIHETQEDADTLKVVDINGIKVALLDYTDSSYTQTLGDDSAYMVDKLDQTKVAADIAKAKENSDCIVVYANWGNEEDAQPSQTQKDWAQFLLQQGVKVTIGVNPRFVQPMETLTDASGNEMLVYYSLGNFVSTQSEVPRLLEGMASFTIEKTVTGSETTVKVTNQSLLPMVMHYNHDENVYNVYMLSDYTDTLAESHSIHDYTEDEFTVSSLKTLFKEQTGIDPDAAPAGSQSTGTDTTGQDGLTPTDGATVTPSPSTGGSTNNTGDATDSDDGSSDGSSGNDSDSDGNSSDDGSDGSGDNSGDSGGNDDSDNTDYNDPSGNYDNSDGSGDASQGGSGPGSSDSYNE